MSREPKADAAEVTRQANAWNAWARAKEKEQAEDHDDNPARDPELAARGIDRRAEIAMRNENFRPWGLNQAAQAILRRAKGSRH